MAKEPEVYQSIDSIPTGHAKNWLVPGCMVLEGGALRGTYTSGVLDALMQENINLQTTIGVSAGALVGLHYVSGQIGRAGRMNLIYRHDERYVGLAAMKQNKGVIGFDFLFSDDHEGIEPFDMDRLLRPERRFVAVATNLTTGKAEFFEAGKCDDIMLACRASASMPYVSKPVMIGETPYLDGGCSDYKIPIQWAMDEGFEKIVVVRTQHRDYRKEISPRTSHVAANTIYRNYPEFADALEQSDELYNEMCDRLLEMEESGQIFMIAPSRQVDISRLEGDMAKLGALYDLGYLDARNSLEGLKEYLGL